MKKCFVIALILIIIELIIYLFIVNFKAQIIISEGELYAPIPEEIEAHNTPIEELFKDNNINLVSLNNELKIHDFINCIASINAENKTKPILVEYNGYKSIGATYEALNHDLELYNREFFKEPFTISVDYNRISYITKITITEINQE